MTWDSVIAFAVGFAILTAIVGVSIPLGLLIGRALFKPPSDPDFEARVHKLEQHLMSDGWHEPHDGT